MTSPTGSPQFGGNPPATIPAGSIDLTDLGQESRPPMTNLAPNPYFCSNTIYGSSVNGLTGATNTEFTDGWKLNSENANVDTAKQTSGGPTSESLTPFTKCHQRLTKKTNAGKILVGTFLPKEQSSLAKDWNICMFQVWLKSSKNATFKANIMRSNNGADSIPDPMVSAWNAASTDPTLAANLTFSGSPISYALSAGVWTKCVYGTGGNDGVDNDGFAIFSDDDMAVDDTLEIAAPMIVRESDARKFDAPPAGSTKAESMRQLEKSYENDTAPGAVSAPGQIAWSYPNGNGDQLYIPFKQPKLKVPTVTLYSPVTGNSGNWDDGGGDIAVSAQNIGESGFSVQIDGAPAGGLLLGHFIADAVL